MSFEFFQHYDHFKTVAQTKRRLQQVFDEILPLTAEVAVEAWRLDGRCYLRHVQQNRLRQAPLYDLVDLDVIVL